MPEQLVTKQKAAKNPRFSYALETEVDRTVREQNRFLDHCQENRVELTLFAVTGATFNGIVHAFDRDTILFGGSGKNATPRLILKRFVAMIIPRDAINLFLQYKGLGTARTKNRKQRFIEAVQNMGGIEQVPMLDRNQKLGTAGHEEADGLEHVGTVVTKKVRRPRLTLPPKDEL
jgi:sRNA-binding regulator protein Hfq